MNFKQYLENIYIEASAIRKGWLNVKMKEFFLFDSSHDHYGVPVGKVISSGWIPNYKESEYESGSLERMEEDSNLVYKEWKKGNLITFSINIKGIEFMFINSAKEPDNDSFLAIGELLKDKIPDIKNFEKEDIAWSYEDKSGAWKNKFYKVGEFI